MTTKVKPREPTARPAPDGRGLVLSCHTCGATATIGFPVSATDMAAMADAFIRSHEHQGGP